MIMYIYMLHFALPKKTYNSAHVINNFSLVLVPHYLKRIIIANTILSFGESESKGTPCAPLRCSHTHKKIPFIHNLTHNIHHTTT